MTCVQPKLKPGHSIEAYLKRPQHLRDWMIAIKPRRYFSLKAYKIGFMQLFALPNHWAIGVKMFKNSSVLESNVPPRQEINKHQFVLENVDYILRFCINSYRTSLWQKQHTEATTRERTRPPQVQAFSRLLFLIVVECDLSERPLFLQECHDEKPD